MFFRDFLAKLNVLHNENNLFSINTIDYRRNQFPGVRWDIWRIIFSDVGSVLSFPIRGYSHKSYKSKYPGIYKNKNPFWWKVCATLLTTCFWNIWDIESKKWTEGLWGMISGFASNELKCSDQRWANNSVLEYYSNNIRIPKYSYSYSVDIFKPNNIRIRIRVIFSNRIIFVFVFGHFLELE